MSDEPIKVCPECKGKVHRLIQPVGIIFKGSGFYVTDNRAKSSTSGTTSISKSSNGSDSKATESKTSEKSTSTSESDD